jgi:lysozyme
MSSVSPILQHRVLKPLFAALAALSLASCSASGSAERAHYPMKSDTKPHDGVKKAHSFPIHGIDISKWQGDIDWQAVKSAGTKFAFIKATEGGDHLDERFHANWAGAKAAGIPRAAYHFVFWCRSAEEQADWFRRHVPRDPGALPPVLDVEWNGHSRTCPKKIDSDLARKKIAILLKAMEEHTGKKPIIYTDIPFHADVLKGHLPEYDFWLRSTAAEPHERYDNREWSFWQYTTTGRVPGIAGAVDRNAFGGSSKEWAEYLKANNVR